MAICFSILKNKGVDCKIEKERIDIFIKQIKNNFDIKTQCAIATNFLVGIYILLNDKNTQTAINDFLNSILQTYKSKHKEKIADSDYFTLSYLVIENKMGLTNKKDINKEMEKYKQDNIDNYVKNNTDILCTLGIIERIQEIWQKQII